MQTTHQHLTRAILLALFINSVGRTASTVEISYVPAASEGTGLTTVFVRRDGDATGTVTVEYATSDGTARAGLDYLATRGTLTFGPSEDSQMFTVPILDDGLAEPDETFTITLSNQTGGAALGAGNRAVGIILDDERPGSMELRFQFRGAGVQDTFDRLASQPDGRIVAMDPFGKLQRYNKEGFSDPNFWVELDRPTGMLVQPDGRTVVVGQFTSINIVSRRGIARLNADGSLDKTFDPGSGISPLILTSQWDNCGFTPRDHGFDESAVAVGLQPDGRILIGGGFDTVDGFSRRALARLNSDGFGEFIPDSVTSIGEDALTGCVSLGSVSVSSSMPSIPPALFAGCGGLTTVLIPDRVTSIGRQAFADCTSLVSITIPSNATRIRRSSKARQASSRGQPRRVAGRASPGGGHTAGIGGFRWPVAGCQPAVRQTASLRYDVPPIANRLCRRLAACWPPTTWRCAAARVCPMPVVTLRSRHRRSEVKFPCNSSPPFP